MINRIEPFPKEPRGGRKRNFNGNILCARGYALSTVCFVLEQVRKYIRNKTTAIKKEMMVVSSNLNIGSF